MLLMWGEGGGGTIAEREWGMALRDEETPVREGTAGSAATEVKLGREGTAGSLLCIVRWAPI